MSHPRTIIQVVPGAPPNVNGVGDYAVSIACSLRESAGVQSEFVVCDAAWRPNPQLQGFRGVGVPRRGSRELLAALESLHERNEGALLLHLSPYGYSAHGAPFWLLDALRTWKRRCPGRRIVVHFHEIYATGYPWTRAFWLSPAQRWCSRQILKIADGVITSTAKYTATLERWRENASRAAVTLPIPSGVGEPLHLPDFRSRGPSMIVFGSAAVRQRAYARPEFIREACRKLQLMRIIDIGPGTSTVAPVGVERAALGHVHAQAIGETLSGARFGYIDYMNGRLAKSSVFAAYCSHGLVPVTPIDNHSESDGLHAGTHYWHPGLPSPDEETITRMAAAAYAWYDGHRVSAHATKLMQLIGISAQ